jgi:histidinol phosphatase-like enzyme (inositol monophosphatase family)
VPGPLLRELREAAEAFALEAGEVTLRYFGGVVPHEAKGDGSPVTQADQESERLLRDRIEARWPEHGILGEEYGPTREGADIRWILDPIDGTRSFMRGVPLYGVLIGVEVEGDPVVGVAHFPALRETVAAGRGLGCRLNGEPCSVSAVSRIDRALVLTTDVERVLSRPEGAGWRRLQAAASFSRTWGDCYGHALVATGRAEVMVDPVLSSWDAGPLLTILTEAGGRFTDLAGEATIHGGSGVSTNGHLHEDVLAGLRTGGGSPDDHAV